MQIIYRVNDKPLSSKYLKGQKQPAKRNKMKRKQKHLHKIASYLRDEFCSQKPKASYVQENILFLQHQQHKLTDFTFMYAWKSENIRQIKNLNIITFPSFFFLFFFTFTSKRICEWGRTRERERDKRRECK